MSLECDFLRGINFLARYAALQGHKARPRSSLLILLLLHKKGVLAKLLCFRHKSILQVPNSNLRGHPQVKHKPFALEEDQRNPQQI